MSSSSDPRHFFQTNDSLSEIERKAAKSKNTHGNPIKLRSKILACTADPHNEGRIYVAQAGGLVENVELESGEVTATYAGPNAPLTCFAISPTRIFAGCWDKSIYSWPITSSPSTTSPVKPITSFGARHADFVKALLYASVGTKQLLISGGADAVILIWDAQTGEKLHALKGHARGVQTLALDPLSLPEDGPTTESITFFSGDSSREIRCWSLTPTHAVEVDSRGGTEISPLMAHETSVYTLRFDADGDLWTASADKAAKCLVRNRSWEADMELVHPDFVRDVIVDEEGGWVVTACRDEEVRLWERATGKLYHTFSGHFEEVTGLQLAGRVAVSVSIDATIRQWTLRPEHLKKAREEAEAEQQGKVPVEEAVSSSVLTEEEERELAELMDEDD